MNKHRIMNHPYSITWYLWRRVIIIALCILKCGETENQVTRHSRFNCYCWTLDKLNLLSCPLSSCIENTVYNIVKPRYGDRAWYHRRIFAVSNELNVIRNYWVPFRTGCNCATFAKWSLIVLNSNGLIP